MQNLAHLLTFLTLVTAYNREQITLPGDIMVGALFPIHYPPTEINAKWQICGSVWEEYGIQRTELLLHYIDFINENTQILPNISIGVEIRDSCWFTPIGLGQVIHFIKDLEIYRSFADCSQSNFPFTQATNSTAKNMAAIIGPASSSVTISVQNLIQLFHIPQIGYAATSNDLSDKNFFASFLRVVPSDFHQAQVMIDILFNFNWSFVALINSKNNYGESGIRAFKNLAKNTSICISSESSVRSLANKEIFDEIFRKLERSPKSRVIVCFCEGMLVRNLFKAARRMQLTGKYLVIGSDGWADRLDVIQNYEREAFGSLSIRIHAPYIHEFDQYYFSLKPETNTRNIWFKEFWQQKFNCSLTSNYSSCSRNNNLAYNYKQDTKLAFILYSIQTVIQGIDEMHKDLCLGIAGFLCEEMNPINMQLLLLYLKNVSFLGRENELIKFDKYGNPPGRYDILNFQVNYGKAKYELVGHSESGNTKLDKDLIVSPLSYNSFVISTCTEVCKVNQIKIVNNKMPSCCWECKNCSINEYKTNENLCTSCELGYWPNANYTGCYPLKIEYYSLHSIEAIISFFLAIVGTSCTMYILYVFIKANETPVIKSSTRELMYIIIFGLFLSFLTPLYAFGKPTVQKCYMLRCFPILSLAVIHAPILVKTNRIYRIMGSKKKEFSRRITFISKKCQIATSISLIFIEICSLITMLLAKKSDVIYVYFGYKRVRLQCSIAIKTGTLISLTPVFFFMALSTLYAVKSRNVPANFNEAKFLGFCMYSTCIIVLSFVILYYGSEFKEISITICPMLCSFVVIALLFFPRIHLIIFRPEKNVRSAFITNKSLRIHYGNSNSKRKKTLYRFYFNH